MSNIDRNFVKSAVGLDLSDGSEFLHLGLVNSYLPKTLTYLDDERFWQELADNCNIAGAFVAPALATTLRTARPSLELIECEDPRWAFWTCYNHAAERDYVQARSRISPSASVSPAAFVSEHNVSIGEGTVIGPNVTILPDVTIGSNCRIQPGAVIGSVGFEVKRTSRGVVSVIHDGVVEIGDNVEIGANTCIDKGFRDRPTVIESEVKIDNLVHVAHSVRVRRGAFLIAGAVLGGSCEVGPDAWLSINASVAPSLTLGPKAFVSIGAVVTRNVGEEQQVTGNFAVPHDVFLRMLKSGLKQAT